ncbi:MAG: hypothetical protein JO243_17505 [Solirubrobacterales bacterium]|nr:hypothetical protein [Solirubrobacterales bacterium]
MPATFVVGSGGKLNPPVITIPAFLAVQLTVASGDARSHRIIVRTPKPYALSVPARGRASIRIGGLRAGRYDIEVDGSTGGALAIGGEPGP